MSVKMNDTVETLVTNLRLAASSATGEGEVSISGFGKFTVVSRPERQVRNPSTGEMMMAKASKTVKFKPSATLKSTL